MTGFVSIFVAIIIGVSFVLSPCKGAIFLDGNKTRVVSPGSNVEIKWTFDDDIDKLIARVWHYATKDEELASIFRKGSVQKTNSSLSTGVEFNEKGTMVLRNVDDSYNGTYSFQVSVTGSAGDISSVDIFVAGPLNITVCSSAITVNESTNVACMSKAERNNTPEAPSVTWYDKDGNQISGVGEGMKELNLNNITRNQAGRYTCKADSYGLRQEKSIQVNVNYKPTITKVEFTQKPKKSGDNATIECEADGQPEPTYIIFGGRVISTENPYTFKVDDTLLGEYFCNATNILGTDSKNTSLAYDKAITPSSTTMTISISSSPSSNSTEVTSEGSESGLGIGPIIGIVIAVLVLVVIIIVVLSCKYKDKCGHGVGEQIGQESDEHELEGREHAYDSIQPQSKASASRKAPSESKDALPPVYATVDKNRKPEGVTYATLDAAAMNSGNKGSRRNEPQPQPAGTEYASIQFGNKDGDSKGAMV